MTIRSRARRTPRAWPLGSADIRQRPEFIQRQPVQRAGILLRNSRAIEHTVHHIVFLQSRWHFLIFTLETLLVHSSLSDLKSLLLIEFFLQA